MLSCLAHLLDIGSAKAPQFPIIHFNHSHHNWQSLGIVLVLFLVEPTTATPLVAPVQGVDGGAASKERQLGSFSY